MNNRSATSHQTRFSYVRRMVFTGWHFMRWLRLGLAIFLGWQFAARPDIITGLVAGFFLFQAVTDTGCCGSAGCSVTPRAGEKADDGSVVYEEIGQREKTNHGNSAS